MDLNRSFIHTKQKTNVGLGLTTELHQILIEISEAFNVDKSAVTREALYSYFLREYPRAKKILKEREELKAKELNNTQYIQEEEDL